MSDPVPHELDARRLLCPMPVIRVQQTLQQLEVGAVLSVTCTDPGVLQDIPAWCHIHGHQVLACDEQPDEIIITIKKGEG